MSALRYLTSVTIPSGRMSLAIPRAAFMRLGYVPAVSSLKCVAGKWYILGVLPKHGVRADVAYDKMMIVHEGVDPCMVEHEASYRMLRSIDSTGRLLVHDSMDHHSKTYSSFPMGTWGLYGCLSNSSKIYSNDFENHFFMLRRYAEKRGAVTTFKRIRDICPSMCLDGAVACPITPRLQGN